MSASLDSAEMWRDVTQQIAALTREIADMRASSVGAGAEQQMRNAVHQLVSQGGSQLAQPEQQPAQVAESVAADSSSAMHVIVRRWDRDEQFNVLLRESDGVESLIPAVRTAFSLQNERCVLYFLVDSDHPQKNRVKVHDATAWSSFWALRRESAAGAHRILYLHTAAQGSPDREPVWLRIDTTRVSPVKIRGYSGGSTPSSSAARTAAGSPVSSSAAQGRAPR